LITENAFPAAKAAGKANKTKGKQRYEKIEFL